MISYKYGDSLDANEEYIVQQCNCVGTKSLGLSYHLAKRYPHANPYSYRKPIKSNGFIAIKEDRPKKFIFHVYNISPINEFKSI